MGRRRKPTVLRLIDGSRKVSNANEPRPQGDLDEPPAWLTAIQAEAWAYAVRHSPRGLLRKLDRSVLAVWCVASATHQEAVLKVAQLGLVVKTADGAPYQNPFLTIQNRQATIMLMAAAQLGFSPCARSSIVVPPDGGGSFSNNGKRPPAA